MFLSTFLTVSPETEIFKFFCSQETASEELKSTFLLKLCIIKFSILLDIFNFGPGIPKFFLPSGRYCSEEKN